MTARLRSNSHCLVLGAILLLAAALRFYNIDAQSLWYDEGNSARIAERSAQLIVEGAAGDIHPPLYYLILKYWRVVIGGTEAALRSFSVACGVLTVLFAYLIGRDLFNKRVGLIAAFFLAVMPFAVYYSQEARMYALLALCAAASTWALVRLEAKSSISKPRSLAVWALYVLATAAGLWTQYAYPFVMIAQGVCMLLFALFGFINASRIPRPVGLRMTANYIVANLVAIALFLPWLPIAIRQMTGWGVARASFDLVAALLDAYRTLVVGRTLPPGQAALPLAAFSAFMAIGLLVPTRRKAHDARPFVVSRLTCFVLAFLPIALLFAFGLYRDAYLKVLLVCVLPMCVLAARGIVEIGEWFGLSFPRKRESSVEIELDSRLRGNDDVGSGYTAKGLIVLVSACIAATLFPSLDNLYNNPAYARDDYRGVQRLISGDARPDDAVIFIAPNQWEVYTYYQGDDRNLFPVKYKPRTYDDVATQLAQITQTHRRIFVLYFAERDADPEGWYEQWLGSNAFKAGEEWIGNIRLAVYRSPAVREWVEVNPDAAFGGFFLEGAKLSNDAVHSGDVFPVELHWKNTAPVNERYKVFIHIGRDDAPPVFQNDGEPAAGLRPTSSWSANETLRDRRAVWIKGGVTGDTLGVFVGMYDALSGQRLTVFKEGQAVGDRLKIGEITILP